MTLGQFSITKRVNNFNQLSLVILSNVRKAMEDTAEFIAKAAAAKAPVDTGALRASIYTAYYMRSNYAAHIANALSKRADAKTFPDIGNIGKWEAIIAVPLEYGIYNEKGTVHMAARPFLAPATQLGRQYFSRQLRKVLP